MFPAATTEKQECPVSVVLALDNILDAMGHLSLVPFCHRFPK